MSRTGIGIAYAVLAFALAACTADVDDPGFPSESQAMGDSEPDDSDDSANPTQGGGTDSNGATSTTGGKGGSSSGTVDPNTTTTSGPAASSGGPAESSGGESESESESETAGMGCGDGVVSPGEQCDGADLQDFDCGSLGLGSGTLGCDPVMCTFDTSMCMSNPGGTSG